MPRRLAALLIALIATVSITGTALGSPRDVINDFLDNGSIDVCHPKADYDGARTESVDSQYGDFQGALDQALATKELVGTDAAPCPTAAALPDTDSGSSVALIAIPVALAFIALAMVLGGKRRRAGQDSDSDDQDGMDPPA